METTRNPDLSAIKQTPQPAWALGGCGGIPEVSEGGFCREPAVVVHEMVGEQLVVRSDEITGPVGAIVLLVDEILKLGVKNGFVTLEGAGIEFVEIVFAGKRKIYGANVPAIDGLGVVIQNLMEGIAPFGDMGMGISEPRRREILHVASATKGACCGLSESYSRGRREFPCGEDCDNCECIFLESDKLVHADNPVPISWELSLQGCVDSVLDSLKKPLESRARSVSLGYLEFSCSSHEFFEAAHSWGNVRLGGAAWCVVDQMVCRDIEKLGKCFDLLEAGLTCSSYQIGNRVVANPDRTGNIPLSIAMFLDEVFKGMCKIAGLWCHRRTIRREIRSWKSMLYLALQNNFSCSTGKCFPFTGKHERMFLFGSVLLQ